MPHPNTTISNVAPHVMRNQDEVSQRNAAISPLLRLPAELRNMIWTLVLNSGQGIQLLRHSEIRISDRIHNRISLLLVCRHIYAETALLPYELHSFYMLSPSRNSLVKFLEGRTRAQMQVMMDVKWWWYSEGRPEVHSAAEWLRMGMVHNDSW